jgi:hypothetical protein
MRVKAVFIAGFIAFVPLLVRAQLPAATGTTYTLPEGSGYTMFVPSNFQASSDPNLIVHFHGDGPTYDANDKYANLNAISVTIYLGGVSSDYQTPFTNNTSLFQDVMNDALTQAKTVSAVPSNASWGKVDVTSFSAGYAAVRAILQTPSYFNRIDGMVLSDTIYASYTSSTDETPLYSQMVNFIQYAQDAAAGTKTLVLTHSQVATDGYASTVATTADILSYIPLTTTSINQTGLGGIQLYETAHEGNFTEYGGEGSDAATHDLFQDYIGQWETGLPMAAIPEPATLTLLLAMISIMSLRRRQRGGERTATSSPAPAGL